ncbi:hypothetical protein ACIRD3_04005 [Kitasatospora sp. NPDC093550]|uniref:hypothetical protein n=1 Tax=Kitasatospora sp. NPDC093550 TaxID=3364089 RepID=UPI0038220FB2
MVFNVGSQQAGVVNNVAHDQHVHDGQSGAIAVGAPELTGLLGALREAVGREQLPPAVAPLVETELNAIDQEAARPEPDREAVAARLARVTRLLREAGAAVAAGTGLFSALSGVAGWLGALGQPILHLLGG